jgi:hypothetical protein
MAAAAIFDLAFIAPEGFSSVRLMGRANSDDTGRVFLNGTAISAFTFFAGRDHGVWECVLLREPDGVVQTRHGQ